MSSSGIIALLMLGILATSIIPTDARQRSLRKRYSRSPSRRQDAVLPEDDDDSKVLLPRIPITKSLARKLSEMLAVAVAEAVAQVVDDEPGRISACDALLRRRSNSNVNVNRNVNKNINKKPKVDPDYELAARIGAEGEEEEIKDPVVIESEELIPDGEEVIEEEIVDPLPQQRRRSNPYARRRRQRSANSNINDNKNINYRRTDPAPPKNATDIEDVEDQFR